MDPRASRDLQEQSLLDVLWRSRYLIAVAVMVSAGLSLVLASTSPKVYEATGILQVASSGGLTEEATDPLRRQQASQGLARTYAELIGERSVIEQMAAKIDAPAVSARELRRRLSARAVEDTALIELRATGTSPADAARLAGQAATAFSAVLEDSANQRIDDQQRLLRSRLDREIKRLRAEPGADRERTARRIASLERARADVAEQLPAIVFDVGAVTLVGKPTAAQDPVSPRPLLNLLAGLLLGALIGIGLAALRMRIDQGVQSSREAEELLDVPVLATIPLKRRFSGKDRAAMEAYEILFSNLVATAEQHDMKVLTFVSYSPGVGKTTTLAGLCEAATYGNVIFVDGDLRTRGLSSKFGLGEAEGIGELAAGTASSADVAVEVGPGVSLVPAGESPFNAPTVLKTRGMRNLIHRLSERSRLVVIDTPAVAHIADASLLASMSDGVVVLARVGKTSRDDLRAVAAELRHAHTPLVGLVLLESGRVSSPYLTEKERPPAVGWPAGGS